jgi:hypothetical protein
LLFCSFLVFSTPYKGANEQFPLFCNQLKSGKINLLFFRSLPKSGKINLFFATLVQRAKDQGARAIRFYFLKRAFRSEKKLKTN